MIKISPRQLLGIVTAANFEIKNYPEAYTTTTKAKNKELFDFIMSVRWDNVEDECLFIDELPF